MTTPPQRTSPFPRVDLRRRRGEGSLSTARESIASVRLGEKWKTIHSLAFRSFSLEKPSIRATESDERSSNESRIPPLSVSQPRPGGRYGMSVSLHTLVTIHRHMLPTQDLESGLLTEIMESIWIGEFRHRARRQPSSSLSSHLD